MELNEAIRRVVVLHVKLIVVCAVAGTGLGLLAHRHDGAMYSATTRVVLDGSETQDASQSKALADAARGFVTSPTRVARALTSAGADRDPLDVSRRVSLAALGTSNVLEVTVRDPSAAVAAHLSNALAADLVNSRVDQIDARLQQVTGDLQSRIDALNAQLGQVDAQIDAVTRSAAGLDWLNAAGIAAATNRVNVLRSQRESLASQISGLEHDRGQLLVTEASRRRPSILDGAGVPSTPDPSRRGLDGGLGALLGLVLGVGLAASLETIRPTLVGGRAVASAAKAPLLAELRSHPARPSALAEEEQLAARIALAAGPRGVTDVVLIGAGRSADVSSLAQRLQSRLSREIAITFNQDATVSLATRNIEPALVADHLHSEGGIAARLTGPRAVGDGEGSGPALSEVGRAAGPVAVRISEPRFRVRGWDEGKAASTVAALVLVAPHRLKLRDLDPVGDVITICEWSLLGVVTYRRRPWHRLRPQPVPTATTTQWKEQAS